MRTMKLELIASLATQVIVCCACTLVNCCWAHFVKMVTKIIKHCRLFTLVSVMQSIA